MQVVNVVVVEDVLSLGLLRFVWCPVSYLVSNQVSTPDIVCLHVSVEMAA